MVQSLVFRANRLPGFVQPCCKVSCFILSICKTNDIGTFSIGFGKRSQLSISRKSNRWKLSYSMLKDGQDEAVMRTCPTLLNWCVTEALLQKLRLKKVLKPSVWTEWQHKVAKLILQTVPGTYFRYIFNISKWSHCVLCVTELTDITSVYLQAVWRVILKLLKNSGFCSQCKARQRDRIRLTYCYAVFRSIIWNYLYLWWRLFITGSEASGVWRLDFTSLCRMK